jgi:iron complex outermembrane recepter protein
MRCTVHVALLAGASALTFASLASGQTTTNPAQANGDVPQATASPAQATSEFSKLEEITVTGSRIIHSALSSPTPLTEVNADDLADVHPTTIGSELTDLPIFSGSHGLSTNPGNGSLTTGPTAPNSSASVLNLRNMGSNRTLVLLDGKRLESTSPDGSIDVNMIPQMLLKRVDIVTGGASAVYGSDAVTGVVNFITDTHFTGLMVNAYTGLSHDGDAFTNDEGLAWGTNLFDGRGHFEVSFENHSDPDVLLRSQRQWGRDVWTVQGAGTTADPFSLVGNTRISTSSFGGLITKGTLSGQQFASNGVLSPFVNGTPTGTPGYQSGGDGAYSNSSFKSALQLNQLFARLDYDFTDSVHGNATFVGVYDRNSGVATQNTLTNVTIGASNAFLSPAYQAALAAAGQSTFTFSKNWLDVPPESTDTWEREYMSTLELQGEFGDGYHWDSWYTHAETRQTTRENTNINNEHLAAALNAVVDPANGQVVCGAALSNPGAFSNCVPLNAFGPTSESQAAINYITSPTQFLAIQTMDDVSASVTGALLHDWAGPVNAALSAEWRRLTDELSSTATPSDAVDCTGIQYNCSSATLLWADGSTPDRSKVAETISEAALELEVPLLANQFMAKNVTFNGAARYTDYDTSGPAVTWKAGLDWQVNDQLTVRATRSKDIRAPTLNELFYPVSLSTFQVTDLLTGQNPLVPYQGGGNPKLVPEVGYTTTAGFVYQPEWLPRFSMTLDGFWITITNAITNIQGTNPTIQDVCYASGGSSPYCLLQQRPNGFTDTSPANAVTKWYNEEINIASQSTTGADLEANYAFQPFPLNLRALVTYQPHLIYRQPGVPTVDLAGVAFSANGLQAAPVWRATYIATYKPVQNFTVDVMERWRSSLAWTGVSTQIVSMPRISSVAYTDLNLSYTLTPGDSTVQVYFNVQNLFNKQPPPGAYLGANGAVGYFGGFVAGDDPIGAYFTLGVRAKL